MANLGDDGAFVDNGYADDHNLSARLDRSR